MVRDVRNRYKGLPPRTPEMLFRIVGKFYRGAVSHYDVIQEKKREAERALAMMRETGNPEPLRQALWVLFCEFHFYVTCWLQIELALYRLARHEETRELADVQHAFSEELKRHLEVREELDDTERCVADQFVHFGEDMTGVLEDRYWIAGNYFTVGKSSLEALHRLYGAIMTRKPN
ncbi:MAG: hypothetical protein H0Z34_08205 [Brevibacillus sp.]|nr:hypothetical protein [Brevibacillus sp.]